MKKLITILYYSITLLLLIFLYLDKNKNNDKIFKSTSIQQTSSGALNNLKDTKDSMTFVDPVLKLDYIDSENSVFSATGFSVSYDKNKDISYILTNHHFCERKVSGDSGEFYYELPGIEISTTSRFFIDSMKIVTTSKSQDLCLLSLNGFIKPAKIAPESYQISKMESVIIVGAPHENFPVISETFISNTVSIKEVFSWMELKTPALFISDIVLPGESGSPIYNKKGEVIGIVDATMSDSSIVFGGVGISFVDIRFFLNESKIPF